MPSRASSPPLVWHHTLPRPVSGLRMPHALSTRPSRPSRPPRTVHAVDAPHAVPLPPSRAPARLTTVFACLSRIAPYLIAFLDSFRRPPSTEHRDRAPNP
ncbi:hypothetical protein DENSPDRAFT_884284 [Dentipellis sp. KUC8613]|nr:hypothetical protein DENSPDRAFT_884284 [Dentipellis sp. KUC8613]